MTMSSKGSTVGIVLVVVCIVISVFAAARQQFLAWRLAGIEHKVKQLEGSVSDFNTTAERTRMQMLTQEVAWQTETGKRLAAFRDLQGSTNERLVEMRKLIDHMRFDINQLRGRNPTTK